MTESKSASLELLDIRGNVLLHTDPAFVASLVAGPTRDRYWIRTADGSTLSARAWERNRAHAA